MNPFRRKTQSEIDAEIAKLKEMHVSEEVSAIFGLGDELTDMIKSQPVREDPTPPTRPMLKREAEHLSAKLAFERLYPDESFDERVPENEHARSFAMEKARDEFVSVWGETIGKKLFANAYGGGGQSHASDADVEDTLRRLNEADYVSHLPGRRHSDDAISKMLHEWLEGYRKGDQGAMRSIVRDLLTDAA